MSLIESSTAEEVLPGQMESCDRYVVSELPAGALLAVVEGVGHAEGAAHSAEMVVGAVNHSEARSLISLLRRCHPLQGTRGAVLRMAWFSPANDTMSWLGVGNVACVLLRKESYGVGQQQALLLRAGILGAFSPDISHRRHPQGIAEGVNVDGSTKEIASTSSGTIAANRTMRS